MLSFSSYGWLTVMAEYSYCYLSYEVQVYSFYSYKDEGPDQRFVQILAANLLTDSNLFTKNRCRRVPDTTAIVELWQDKSFVQTRQRLLVTEMESSV